MKAALIGLKGHYGTVLHGLRAAGCELVAVCDEDEATLGAARSWTQSSPDLRAYTDYRQLLDREELDIVGEAGTDNLRAEVVVACAQRGLHVLAEKPLAHDLAQLEQVREAVAASDIHLSMLLTMRYEPAYRVIREQVAAGAIGEVCQAAMQKSYRLGTRPAWQCSRETFSGIIPFIGIHGLDLIRWTSGREFTRAAGFAANTGHPEIGDLEDNACMALELDNGASAGLRLDYCRPAAADTHGDDRLRLAGNRGVIESLACGTRVNLITADEGSRELELPEHADQFVNFVATIRGEATSDVPAADCLRMTEVVLKIREATTGGLVADLRPRR